MANEQTPVRRRDAGAVAGYALGFGGIVAALLTVLLDLAAPGLPWIVAILIGLVVGGGIGAAMGRARGVDV